MDAKQSTPAAEIIFTMGLPGAGKSTTMGRMGLLDTHTVIDPDAIKLSIPGYDPKNPEAVHAQSKLIAERQFKSAIAAGEGLFVVDGTGTNSDKMVRRIREAQAMGFTCKVLYVRVKLSTSIERNANRERVVPEYVIREKALDITTAFEIVARFADEMVVVDND